MPDEQSLRIASLECFLNAKSLHEEACLLGEHGYRARAAALAVIGEEEFAKSILYALAAIRPDEPDLLGKGLIHHETKHLVALVAEVAEIETNDYRAVAAQESGQPLSPKERLVVLFQRLVRSNLEAVVKNPTEAKTFYKRLGDTSELVLPEPQLKNAALYVDLGEFGDISTPARVEHQAASAILGLEWFLGVYCAVPEILQDEEEWKDFCVDVLES